MTVTIQPERPDSPDARMLIAELDELLAPMYEVDSRYGYSVDKLLAQKVEFFIVRSDGAAAGCCGIQFFGDEFGELKRMYVRPALRGMGLARKLLEHVEEHARKRGVELMRLETGIYQTDAIRLYEGMGYRRIPPFGVYTEDPVSRCYEKRISLGSANGERCSQ